MLEKNENGDGKKKRGRGRPRKDLMVQTMKRRQRIEKMLLRGISNQSEMAAAFGVSPTTINNDIKVIYNNWRQSSPSTENERNLRVHQVESIALLALNEFERSRLESKEVTVIEKTCKKCGGDGQLMKERNDESGKLKLVLCSDCEGKGKTTVETVKVKQQVGDSSFLKVAKDCVVEAARLRGLSTAALTTSVLTKIKSGSKELGGEIEQKVEAMVIEAPIDTIIKAKVALDEIRERIERKEARVIETDSKKTIDTSADSVEEIKSEEEKRWKEE